MALFLLGRSLREIGMRQQGEELISRALKLDSRAQETREAIAPPRYRGRFWSLDGPVWEGRLGDVLLDRVAVITGLSGWNMVMVQVAGYSTEP